jgi:hypothetical protein
MLDLSTLREEEYKFEIVYACPVGTKGVRTEFGNCMHVLSTQTAI